MVVWWYMYHKMPDKLHGMKVHDFALFSPIIFVPKLHLIAFYLDNTLVTDGDLVAVACQVVDDGFSPVDTGLTLDHPFLFQMQSCSQGLTRGFLDWF
jgi:hypothetical protein